jgi:hypothetical protein
MIKLLIGLLALGTITNAFANEDLSTKFRELQNRGSSDEVAQIRTKGRVLIGLADSIIKVQVNNDAQSYLQLKDGNICNEFVYGLRVTYTCVNAVGDTYLEKQVTTK